LNTNQDRLICIFYALYDNDWAIFDLLQHSVPMREFRRARTIRKDLQFTLDENARLPPPKSSLQPTLQVKTQVSTAPLIDLTPFNNDRLTSMDDLQAYHSRSKHDGIEDARAAWGAYRTSQLELGMKRIEEVALQWLHLRTAERDQTGVHNRLSTAQQSPKRESA
jgi:hypothetical protein